MLNWIKNNKKLVAIIGIVGAIVIILGGSIFGMNAIKYNTEKDYLSIGIRQKDKQGISFGRDEKASQKEIEEIRAILGQAKGSALTDETAGEIQGKELIFEIEHGTYVDTKTEMMVEMWIQEDGSAIYREGVTKKYYTLDKESTQKLQALLK